MSDELNAFLPTESLTSDSDTEPRLSGAERAILHAAYLESVNINTCPNCQHPFRPGELTCDACGVVLAEGGKTNKILIDDPLSPKKLPVGKAMVAEQTPIIFDINGTSIALPMADTLIVGRRSPVPDDPQPDVPLNAFGADQNGVSRRHVKLSRRGDLVYVTDLGSSNGTFLNGRPITHHRERILRSDDELQLGYLKLKIRF
jgi:hypothetical protein